MHVFLTGASGFVGSAVLDELLAHGHQVSGLVRSDEAAASIAAKGARVVRGTLSDLDVLHDAAASADAVIHTAFIHDFSKFAESCEIDRAAILAFGDALARSGRTLIVTTGTGLLSPGQLATEDTVAPNSEHIPRLSEQTGLAQLERGVQAMVVRLPPSVHGPHDHGFVPVLIGIAKQKGYAAWVGAGQNVWAAVARTDAAKAYRLALERGVPGRSYHAIGDEGVPFKDMATVIGRRLGIPARSIAQDEAAGYFGWFERFAGFDNPSAAPVTRETLGWVPTGPGLIEELDSDVYFPV